eukprot:Trichotokara_eunicae@DN4177_c0_g1_i1.p1
MVVMITDPACLGWKPAEEFTGLVYQDKKLAASERPAPGSALSSELFDLLVEKLSPTDVLTLDLSVLPPVRVFLDGCSRGEWLEDAAATVEKLMDGMISKEPEVKLVFNRLGCGREGPLEISDDDFIELKRKVNEEIKRVAALGEDSMCSQDDVCSKCRDALVIQVDAGILVTDSRCLIHQPGEAFIGVIVRPDGTIVASEPRKEDPKDWDEVLYNELYDVASPFALYDAPIAMMSTLDVIVDECLSGSTSWSSGLVNIEAAIKSAWNEYPNLLVKASTIGCD